MPCESAHFTRDELKCKDCGLCDVDQELLDALEELRAQGPEPIKVHDACRCLLHNKLVGGVSKSEHLFWPTTDEVEGKPCEAADVEIVGLSLQEMYDRAKKVSAFVNGGIGIYDNKPPFIHVDVRHHVARWARVAGKYVNFEESNLVAV